jgi:hypothetical protein
MVDGEMSPGWRERWLLWRNSWLSDPRFQRWSMRLPLLRGTAQRHANAMFGVITGFVYTKTLTAAVDLGIIAACAEAMTLWSMAKCLRVGANAGCCGATAGCPIHGFNAGRCGCRCCAARHSAMPMRCSA